MRLGQSRWHVLVILFGFLWLFPATAPAAGVAETVGSVELELSFTIPGEMNSNLYRVFLAKRDSYTEAELFRSEVALLTRGQTSDLLVEETNPRSLVAAQLATQNENVLVFGLFDPVLTPLDLPQFMQMWEAFGEDAFAGFEITRFELVINEVFYEYAIDAGMTEGRVSATLTVYGVQENGEGPVAVPLDIKPTSCPNPINVGKGGVLPAAILGTADLNVEEINVASIELKDMAEPEGEGVKPLRFDYEDVAAPYVPFEGKTDCFAHCTTEGSDGHRDLTLKFKTSEVVKMMGYVIDRECRVLTITGTFDDGTPFEGEDVVLILLK